MSEDPHVCEKCGHGSHVIDSRPNEIGRKRRLECVRCGHRWTTLEIKLSTYGALKALETKS